MGTDTKITNDDIFMANILISYFNENRQKWRSLPDYLIKNITNRGGDIEKLKELAVRMIYEPNIPENSFRYQAKGTHKGWDERDNNEMRNILNEFDIVDNRVEITPDEFLDILAHIAEEYYG